MNSIREQILQRLAGVLGVVAAAHNASVHRSPTVAIEREHCPALVLFPETDQISERANDRVTRELTVRITALARAIRRWSPRRRPTGFSPLRMPR